MKKNYDHFKFLSFLFAAMMVQGSLYAQTADGNNGINQANTTIRGLFDTAVLLLYALGGIIGLIGAYKVYSSFTHRDGRAAELAAIWFGAAIFLALAPSILKAFFGL